MLLLYLLEVKRERGAIVEIIVIVVVRIQAERFVFFRVEDRHGNMVTGLPALQYLFPQSVILRLEDSLGINSAAIDHDREEAEGASVLAANDSDGLSGSHALPHVDEVLRVIGIDGLEAVVVSDDDGVAVLLGAAGEAYGTIEHGFHRIAFRGRYLKGSVLDRSFSYR